MKTIKSSLLGAKQLIDTAPDVLQTRLKEIIKEHRALIINSMMSELPVYLDYKFNLKPDKSLLDQIRSTLVHLKNSGVGIEHYLNEVTQLMSREVIHLTNEPFYNEIDEHLKSYVRIKQERLVY